MIEEYFLKIEEVLREFPSIRSRALTHKVYNHHQGYISGKIVFENGHSFEFIEVVDTEQDEKVKYRYQYMDKEFLLIFRYDNAPHHKKIKTFPHHKHVADKVTYSQEPDLQSIMIEITKFQRQEK